MSLFLHPHLTRGTVHTPMGSFVIKRGLVDMPDDVGRTLGWEPVESDDEWMAGTEAAQPRGAATHRAQPAR
jgi:hypothetical protein